MSKPKRTTNQLLEYHLKELGLAFTPEFRFSKTRRWRFDYLINDLNLAIEIEGAVFAGGRHTRGKGFEADCVKYNTATMMGYRVLRFSSTQVQRGIAKAFLAQWQNGGL